ncbi:MAG: zeta toxin, partial [uncultured bacterium]
MDGEFIRLEAKRYARSNRKNYVKKFILDESISENPIAIFMGGSPGAGKTETSKGFIDHSLRSGVVISRIDPDEIRNTLPGYTGDNSSLFQHASSLAASNLILHCIKHKNNFLFDSTLSNYESIRNDILKCIDNGFSLVIIYVHQDPIMSYKFTKERRELDRRHITKEVFINSLFKSLESVKKLHVEFNSNISFFVIHKDILKDSAKPYFGFDKIDRYI